MRWGNAWSALGTAVICILVATFIVDFCLEMSRPQRFVSLMFVAGALYWCYSRFTRPFLGHTESELDIALLVEKEQEIDTDLVAALQFETPAASQWGSSTLEQAVIDYVADFGQTINVFKGFNATQLKRRLGTFAFTAALFLVATGLHPKYTSAFFNRLLLGSRHYPTRTVIEQILVNGQAVDVDGGTAELKFPFGHALRIEVACSGDLPSQGRVKLATLEQGSTTTIKLEPRSPEPQAGRQDFLGEQPRLVDSVVYQIYLGDAWTDPVRLKVIPLPVVLLDLEATAPDYAARVEKAIAEKSGARQIAVLEGSRVDFKLTCSNKPLESAILKIDDKPLELVPADADKMSWTLPEGETPFTRIMAPVRYEIQVKDVDGLALEQPIIGFIRIKGDRPPRIIAGVISKRVLPEAKPRISFGATDDYGLAKIRVIQEVTHEDGTTKRIESDVETIAPDQQPQTVYKGRFAADLKKMKLVKGDQLKLTLEAIDYRGGQPGKAATSEPLVLDVTDVQGFLAGMAETDEQSARRLDVIIQKQLGIGETK
ncbi:MAG: hypothetical protein JWM11_498 [Planctomycetaceae bacterium]|nr:hypothetical protein [Planctomycetaceae bacterium]